MAAHGWAPQARNFPSSRAAPILSPSHGSGSQGPSREGGRAAGCLPRPAAALTHQSGMYFQFLRHPSPSSVGPNVLLPILPPARGSGPQALRMEDGSGTPQDSPSPTRPGQEGGASQPGEGLPQGPAPKPSGPMGKCTLAASLSATTQQRSGRTQNLPAHLLRTSSARFSQGSDFWKRLIKGLMVSWWPAWRRGHLCATSGGDSSRAASRGPVHPSVHPLGSAASLSL